MRHLKGFNEQLRVKEEESSPVEGFHVKINFFTNEAEKLQEVMTALVQYLKKKSVKNDVEYSADPNKAILKLFNIDGKNALLKKFPWMTKEEKAQYKEAKYETCDLSVWENKEQKVSIVCYVKDKGFFKLPS